MKRARPPTRPLSVLVVDGYPDAAASLAVVLNLEGFVARIALSGQEAMAAVDAEFAEVVVVEPRTPGGGWDLARRLAAPVGGKCPLLVALTTDTTAAGREAAHAIGIGTYLVKPEYPTVLIDLLRQLQRAAGPGTRPPTDVPASRISLSRTLSGPLNLDGPGLAELPTPVLADP